MNSKIWLSSPHMGGNELKYIQEAFDQNWVAPLGPNVNGLEADLTAYLGGHRHIAALTSGTAAIHLALIILGVSAGDEVICQSFTFSATANPITYQGATPVFVDSERDTWNMDPVALEEAVKDRIAKGQKTESHHRSASLRDACKNEGNTGGVRKIQYSADRRRRGGTRKYL